MTVLHLVEFTDPACPWAFSAEPARRRLAWLYGDQLAWDVTVVGLADSAEAYLERGFTTEVQAEAFREMRHAYGMPMDDRERERIAATVPACRAVVAARLNAPGTERLLNRWLAVLQFGGLILDDPATIAAAAERTGLDPEALAAWMRAPATEAALEADMAAARAPTPAALAQPDRLADWEGGRRYTCPSYEITRVSDGARTSVPGFQPLRTYEAAIANLAPGLHRRASPTDARVVLEHFDGPLSTQEVAAVMDVDLDEARERLRGDATFEPIGQDGYWTLAGP